MRKCQSRKGQCGSVKAEEDNAKRAIRKNQSRGVNAKGALLHEKV